MNLFDDILTNDAKKEAETKVFDKWSTRNSLTENVRYSRQGLEDLLASVKNVHRASKMIENDFEWYQEAKRDFDAIALLIEEFVEDFKPLYQDMSNKYIAEKLTNDGKKSDGYLTYVDSVYATTGKGWRKP